MKRLPLSNKLMAQYDDRSQKSKYSRKRPASSKSVCRRINSRRSNRNRKRISGLSKSPRKEMKRVTRTRLSLNKTPSFGSPVLKTKTLNKALQDKCTPLRERDYRLGKVVKRGKYAMMRIATRKSDSKHFTVKTILKNRLNEEKFKFLYNEAIILS